ncbi:type II and III secretion system protein family protein [Qipengyuania sp. 1NDH17]|uniref:Type II and III secretion system protein family protein n=1 Tax=Qipengyuania polymorpha TaxID=2867234 RepID=A0ABS7IZK0_9SPHN|nr:type II and III secretion system protein family protein [Qipengyuania polymorpha]MBX7459003.1 type II and III secretion system protein family protein [Qipengyuania polymorpha]
MKQLKTPITALALALAGTALVPTAVQAQVSGDNGMSMHAGTVEIAVNKSQVLTADTAIDRAMIGNDEIADILPVSTNSIYVLGKEVGTTSLTLYDRNNRVIAVMDISVGPDVAGLREQMTQLMPGQPVQTRVSNGAIVLSGTVSDAGVADRAVQLARAYAPDEKIVNLMQLGGSQQVMLEVRFAEVSRSVGKDLGVSSFITGGRVAGATGNGAGLPGGGYSIGGGNNPFQIDSIQGGFGIVGRAFSDVLGVDIDLFIDALEEKGMAKTLAEPTLIALSGETASFLAGGEFPIPVVQNGGGGGQDGGNSVTVEFKPFGVSLGFTPTVLSDKVINLVVQPEVSSIDPTASININGLQIPGLQTRRANTVLELRDGESFAIAGLLQRDFKTTVNQVPLLGSIPIIGSLFRSTSFQRGETELLIVVTPRLVAPIKPEQVRLPTDRVYDPSEADVLLLDGEGYKPRPLDPITGDVPADATPATEGDDYDY